jgi:hypothetical protein
MSFFISACSFLPFLREGGERSETEGLEFFKGYSNHLPRLRRVLLLKKEEKLRGHPYNYRI